VNTVPVPQGTRGIPSRQAETEAPSSANYLRNKVANKAPRHASRPDSSSVKFALDSGAKEHPWVLITVLMQLQCLRVLP